MIFLPNIHSRKVIASAGRASLALSRGAPRPCTMQRSANRKPTNQASSVHVMRGGVRKSTTAHKRAARKRPALARPDEEAARFTSMPSDAEFLAFLRKHDLRPSEADAIFARERKLCDEAHSPEAEARADPHATRAARGGQDVDSEIVHITDPELVLKATRAYALGCANLKHAHESLLSDPASDVGAFVVVPRASPSPLRDARAVLLYTRHKRGRVHLVHVRDEHRRRGYARRLATAVQDVVPERGSLTVDTPACTARGAVFVWLSAGFMGDNELLTCHLAEDAAYVGNRSVRLTFVWQKAATPADEAGRVAFLQKVKAAHPELRDLCERAASKARGDAPGRGGSGWRGVRASDWA